MFNFRKHDSNGNERPDNRPLAVRLGFKKPLTLAQQIARLTQDRNFMAKVAAAGHDTFDEADDFEIGDPEPDGFRTPYEQDFDHISPQTRLDELSGGMVEDMPEERKSRAYEALRPKKKESVANTETKPAV